MTFSQVNTDHIGKDMQTYLSRHARENGIYLYYEEPDEMYVYLHGMNSLQGENSIYYTDFSVKANADTLEIHYSSNKTSDYSDRTLAREGLYKVHLDKKYSTIQAFHNGEEVPFNDISS
ncbi:hypothetical protein [Ornithinibacillus xuwenensis]|uniref:Uncharacterized protein n=1 Tax=Ornithinibacillus xuwenensis TaxID=3144668 RepID=A0ABU9XBL1_9BACI